MRRSAEGSTYKHNDGKQWVARLRYTDKEGMYREKKRVRKTHKEASITVRELKAKVEFEKRIASLSTGEKSALEVNRARRDPAQHREWHWTSYLR